MNNALKNKQYVLIIRKKLIDNSNEIFTNLFKKKLNRFISKINELRFHIHKKAVALNYNEKILTERNQ